MKLSDPGKHALEGREGCRLKAYKDTKGIPTIGYGHTGRCTPPLVRMGMQITQAKADAYFAADLAPIEECINEVIKRRMTQNQYDAMVSLAHNIGEPGFRGSTVVHMVNAGNVHAAAKAFLMWEKPRELIGRREGEFAQFLTPDGAPYLSVHDAKEMVA